ncbi:MAG: nucleotidyl transferase AbiEii/AbiGii toxin family protein [Alphaproteobacteria bacterium]|nr:nucleotidyl transferase AbiEii/AbiGii toxin family protein [Alphaproteobacteria bacterium]MDE2351009.1 nucleotidyl transferase AbiEii/AbiGii toxin family protein [Alphaproteobacteria bacterium]
MAKDLKNVGASVRAPLLNLSKASGQSFDLVLTRFALERLLFRISQSRHANRFVLKGAMLLVSWFKDPHRGTRDLDLLGHLRHRHQEVLVEAAGQLPQHLGFAAADHNWRRAPADLRQSGIAGDAPAFAFDLMLVQQLPGWPQAVLVDELNDRDQLFELVLRRSPRQNDRIGAVDTL